MVWADDTPTPIETPTDVPEIVDTDTPIPVGTYTITPTVTPTFTMTPTMTITATATITLTATITPTPFPIQFPYSFYFKTPKGISAIMPKYEVNGYLGVWNDDTYSYYVMVMTSMSKDTYNFVYWARDLRYGAYEWEEIGNDTTNAHYLYVKPRQEQ
jgi:hypothetical protein